MLQGQSGETAGLAENFSIPVRVMAEAAFPRIRLRLPVPQGMSLLPFQLLKLQFRQTMNKKTIWYARLKMHWVL
jgi:hypothetical protein